jgi:hypothetical protein
MSWVADGVQADSRDIGDAYRTRMICGQRSL